MTKLNSLKDLGHIVRSNSVRRAELLSYLARYQKENPGQTPSIDCMINELGDSEELVRLALAGLEGSGDIHIISRFPLRISLTGPGLENANRLSPLPEDPDRSRRFLEADGMRHQLGRFIGQTWKDKGRGPSLREMMDAVAYQNPGYVSRMAEILAQKGLVQYGHGVPTKLTAAGQRFYGFEPKEGTNTMPPLSPTPVVVVPKTRTLSLPVLKRRVDALCTLAAEHQAKGGGTTDLRLKELTGPMGFSEGSVSCIREIIVAAAEFGYLAVMPEPGLRGKKPHDFTFTEEGRRKFLDPILPLYQPDVRIEPRDERPMEVVDTFVPPVGLGTEGRQKFLDPILPLYQPDVRIELRDERLVDTFVPPVGLGTARMTQVADIPTADMVLELIERGYTVRKN